MGSSEDSTESGERLDATVSRAILGKVAPTAPADVPAVRSYLLVVEADSSTVFELPGAGNVVIGRAKGADVQLKDPAVSRAHARLTIRDGVASVGDLGSHNGTFVGDERVAGTRVLASGDVIGVCETSIVFYTSQKRTARRATVDLGELLQQVETEIDRASRHQGSVTIALLDLGADVDREKVHGEIAPLLRFSDTVAWTSPSRLILLLPEAAGEDASQACDRLLATLVGSIPAARAGLASFPADGADVQALMAGAREAVSGAGPGASASASRAYRRLEIGPQEAIVADPAMARVYSLIERLAASDLSVVIGGETGTGKELAALAVHSWSRRRDGPLCALNCGAVPESLVESELFGHVAGAFTGATTTRAGLLEGASGGTVFLDEVGELPPSVQVKLLRVLETRKLHRLGESRERELDIRIVAATNRDLQKEVEAGRFRRDLYFRLSAGTVWLPPLRDRPRELAVLTQVFLAEACAKLDRPPLVLSDAALHRLSRHRWPGNVRELKNLVEWLAATVQGRWVDETDVADRLKDDAAPLPAEGTTSTTDGAPTFKKIDEEIRELERRRMGEALAASAGNKTRAAALIGMPLRSFMRKCEQYGLG